MSQGRTVTLWANLVAAARGQRDAEARMFAAEIARDAARRAFEAQVVEDAPRQPLAVLFYIDRIRAGVD